MTQHPKIQPFRITIDEDVLADMGRRLSDFRVPPHPVDAGWKYGVDIDYLEELICYWNSGFDWSKQQKKLNDFAHYMAQVEPDGMETIKLHLIHARARDADVPTLLMVPGWPSSIWEYNLVIDRLTHPEKHGGQAKDAVHVVAVDLPGFGLSDAPSKPMTHRNMARYLRTLMVDVLNISKFYVQGGDWGAVTGSWLALDFPDTTEGLFLTMLGLRPGLQRGLEFSDAEKIWMDTTKKRMAADGGYREVQATKPSTLAVGLSDSPAALLGWMIEKYHGWSGDPIDGPPLLDRDEILTSATLYWWKNRLPTANWIYWADRNAGDIGLNVGQRIETPTGFAFFDRGFFPIPPSDWTKRAYNEVYRREYKSGGHFAAWTNPDDFTASLTGFLSTLR